VTGDRLTRTELAWLLTQEARSASQKLRQGGGISGPVHESAPPPPVLIDEGSGGVESTLNRLDEAVSMLASLHGGGMHRGRRGKIDIAALLWEVAPEAKVQLEMGEGTTVFADEGELRRMLHMLIGQGGDPSSAKGAAEVFVRREGDEVRVGVNLGPDTPATFENERAWLSRMALRYGGRLDLDGSMQTLTLPADVDNHRREIETLRKELAAAQAQGEAYARELAAVFSRSDSGSVRAPADTNIPVRASHLPASADGLAVLVAAMRGLGTGLRGILSAIGRDITPLREREGEAGEIASSVARHVIAASEIVADLNRLGSCPLGELPRHSDVADLLRDIVREDTVRAARHDVRLVVEAPSDAHEMVPVGALTVLLHALLDDAINASPPGSQVTITLTERENGLSITFDDAGTPLPVVARSGVLSREFETVAAGRPAGLSLIAGHAIAAHIRMPLTFSEAPEGGARIELTIQRPSP
jgi:two-component system, OmpR family, sensor kinase